MRFFGADGSDHIAVGERLERTKQDLRIVTAERHRPAFVVGVRLAAIFEYGLGERFVGGVEEVGCPLVDFGLGAGLL